MTQSGFWEIRTALTTGGYCGLHKNQFNMKCMTLATHACMRETQNFWMDIVETRVLHCMELDTDDSMEETNLLGTNAHNNVVNGTNPRANQQERAEAIS